MRNATGPRRRRGAAWLRLAGPAALAIAVGCHPQPRVSFSPDSTRYATLAALDVKQKNARLVVCEVTGGPALVVDEGPLAAFAPRWTPDGRGLVYLRAGESEDSLDVVHWIDAGSGSSGRVLTSVTMKKDVALNSSLPVQISADGRVLYCVEGESKQKQRIVRIDTASGEKSVLLEDAALPVLSPDGQQLAVILIRKEEGCALALLDPSGGEPRVLAERLATFESIVGLPPLWSPDGRRLVACAALDEAGKDEDVGLILVDARTGSTRRLSDEEARAPSVWAPDSESLFVLVDGGGVTRTVRVDVGTGRQHEVPGGHRALPAGVSPDGRWLAVRFVPAPEHDNDDLDEIQVVRLIDLREGTYEDRPQGDPERLVLAAGDLERAFEHCLLGREREAESAIAAAEARLADLLRGEATKHMSKALRRLRREADALRAYGACVGVWATPRDARDADAAVLVLRLDGSALFVPVQRELGRWAVEGEHLSEVPDGGLRRLLPESAVPGLLHTEDGTPRAELTWSRKGVRVRYESDGRYELLAPDVVASQRGKIDVAEDGLHIELPGLTLRVELVDGRLVIRSPEGLATSALERRDDLAWALPDDLLKLRKEPPAADGETALPVPVPVPVPPKPEEVRPTSPPER